MLRLPPQLRGQWGFDPQTVHSVAIVGVDRLLRGVSIGIDPVSRGSPNVPESNNLWSASNE